MALIRFVHFRSLFVHKIAFVFPFASSWEIESFAHLSAPWGQFGVMHISTVLSIFAAFLRIEKKAGIGKFEFGSEQLFFSRRSGFFFSLFSLLLSSLFSLLSSLFSLLSSLFSL